MEITGRTITAWWVDSPDVPSLYATTSHIGECRRTAMRMLAATNVDTSNICLVLAED